MPLSKSKTKKTRKNTVEDSNKITRWTIPKDEYSSTLPPVVEGGAPYVGLHDAQAECVCLAIEWEGIYVPAIEYEGNGQSTVGCGDEVPVQVKCVPDQDAKEVTVSKKTKDIKKVWTRL